MRFLVIEGLDGSGKSTQIKLLKAYLDKKNINYRYLHFPRLEEGLYGTLIARFLRGEMGEIDKVDPYLVALIFAGDRKDAKPLIEKWIDQDNLVILDRYVYSNIAFQGAKYIDPEEQKKLADWIMNLEYNIHQLPVPDMNIFLDVPFSFTEKLLSGDRKGADRKYLNGAEDIHENDLEFQAKVRGIYHTLCNRLDNLTILNCADEAGEMKAPDKVFESLRNLIGI
jgi:dTMP kinase